MLDKRNTQKAYSKEEFGRVSLSRTIIYTRYYYSICEEYGTVSYILYYKHSLYNEYKENSKAKFPFIEL